MGLFGKKNKKMDKTQREAIQNYKEAIITLMEIDNYRDYIREMPEELKKKEDEAYNKQVEAILAADSIDLLDGVENEAIAKANRNIRKKYGQPPAPDMDYVNSVKKLHPDEYQQVIACGIVEHLIVDNRYSGSKNGYFYAVSYHSLGHDILLHTNETDACVDAAYEDIIKNDDRAALQLYMKIFDDFVEAQEKEKKKVSKGES